MYWLLTGLNKAGGLKIVTLFRIKSENKPQPTERIELPVPCFLVKRYNTHSMGRLHTDRCGSGCPAIRSR